MKVVQRKDTHDDEEREDEYVDESHECYGRCPIRHIEQLPLAWTVEEFCLHRNVEWDEVDYNESYWGDDCLWGCQEDVCDILRRDEGGNGLERERLRYRC